MTGRKKIFLTLLLIIQLGLIWPVYNWFGGIQPFIFGLPLSFAWIVGMLISAFFLLLWYYLSDPQKKNSTDINSHS